jgi:hypothetical protein
MHYRDVLIHTGSTAREPEYLKDFPPVQTRLELSDQIWIGRLDEGFAKLVIDACDSRYFGPIPHERGDWQLYSYVRELNLPDSDWRWDHDHRLEATVAISRLIHPTSAGLLSAARVSLDDSGNIEQIYGAVRSGISSEVFLSRNRKRNWLVVGDAAVLCELIPRLPLPLSQRVHNAFWHHEYAARTYYINHRWSFICTGLAALVHTDRGRNTAQFVQRVPALASELGISISEEQAGDAYEVRSHLAHGVSLQTAGPGGPPTSLVELYDCIEDILRLAALRSMRDARFADIFADDDLIRSRWPLRH